MVKINKEKTFDPRPYMQLVIEEMRKSKNEPRADGKIPPKVGAILLFSDGTIEKAHRGELREGDHAEYTLLERKLGHKRLDDCILFTTLEPCVKRNDPKIACCKRTFNARIKVIYVGIADPDPTVDGKGIKHLESNGAKVYMFDRDLQKIIEGENKDFISQAFERKLTAQNEVEIIAPLELPLVDLTLKDLSEEALQKFIAEAKLDYNIGDKEFQKYLNTLGVLTLDKDSGLYRPTGIGILLFGNNPRLALKQSALKAFVDYGSGKIEPITFDQPLVLIPDLVQDWLKKVIPLSKNTSEAKLKNIPDFPFEVLREAYINAIVHRDYTIDGAKSYLEIDNDKIVIKSPGAPLPSISLGQLNTFKAPSISRNPIIAYVFNLMGYAEETGFGMKTIKSLNNTYNLPLPEYTFENPFLTLTFPRNFEAIKKITHHHNIDKLSNKELEGYEWIKSKDEISTREYSSHFNMGYKTAQRHLMKMKDLDLISDNAEPINSPKYKYIAIG